MKKTILVSLLLIPLISWNAFAGPFDGEWVNLDANTRSIPKVEISTAENGDSQLVWWGKTHPKNSRYGPLGLSLVTDGSLNKFVAKQDSGFADKIFTITRDGDELVVECLTLFRDNSKRSNYKNVQRFRRAR